MKNRIAKKQSKVSAMVFLKCKICDKEFHSFFLMREPKGKEHGAQRGSRAHSVDALQLMGDVDDKSLKQELETSYHVLVDSEMLNGRHRVYNFCRGYSGQKYLQEKLDVVFYILKCASKLNVAFGFVLRNVEDGSWRSHYAHENITLLGISKLVATTEDLKKIKNLLSNTDFSESCNKKRANTKGKNTS